MAKIIPNDQTWIGWIASGGLTDTTGLVPTQAEINAATDLTPLTISLNASTQGNVVPTPSFDTLFETNIVGTSQASFTADFYRDDTADTAWDAFDRGDSGYFVVSRFGGTGAANKPQTSDVVEVWPVAIVSKTNANLQNNTVQTFTVTGAVPQEPNENATVT